MSNLDKFSFHNGLCFIIWEEIDETWKINRKISVFRTSSNEFQLKDESLYRKKLTTIFDQWEYGSGNSTFTDDNSERLFIEECYNLGIGFEIIRLINAKIAKQKILL
jgi:hypothetical protein